MYFYLLNSYPGASEFLGTLDGTMILGFTSGFVYSTLTLVAFVPLKGLCVKQVFQRCQ